MMNQYIYHFTLTCPVNGAAIRYTLIIETWKRVMVEEILQQVAALPDPGFHEDTADLLAAKLPGRQTLRAHHHGVDIETQRSGL